MRRAFAAIFRRIAPRTAAGLADLNAVREQFGSLSTALDSVGSSTIEQMRRDNEQMRAEIDELRREGRYVAELYDLVVERARADSSDLRDAE